MRTLSLFFVVLCACGSQSSPLDVPAAPLASASVDGGVDAPGSTDIVDSRDGQTYKTLAIGEKRWLARNLNFDSVGSSFCYGDDSSNCDKDGRLYLWSVARTVCPLGTHLPSDDEWKALEASLGMGADQLDLEGYDTPRGTSEGSTLKLESGFGAHMAGYRTGKAYEALGDRTYFWTATTRGNDVWRRRIAAATPNVFRFTNPPSTFAISVRCVGD